MAPTSRRDFLRQSLLAAGGCTAHVLLNAACATGAQRARWTAPANPVVLTSPFARIEAIGRDAWAVISTPLGGDRTTFANGGIIAGRNGVVAIEAFYRPAGAEWLARQTRQLTGRWPTHVVLSHYHVDHCSGVSGFGVAAAADGHAAPRMHATEPTRQLVVKGGPVAPAKEFGVDRTLADMVVVPHDAPSRIDLGDRVLTLQPFTGHTGSDLTVHDDEHSLSWTGDLVWHRMFPNYVDATPTKLAASVRAMATRMDTPGAVMVPGHGALVTKAGIADYLGLLDSLEATARAGHAAGIPPAQVAATYRVPASLGEWMANPASVERAITAWYRELR